MLKLAATTGLALAVANLKRRARNTAVRAILAAIGIAFVLGAAAFFLTAAHVSLSARFGSILSAGVIGGVLLIIGLLFLFLASRPMREQARGVEQPAARLGDALGEGMSRLALAAGSSQSPLRNPVFQAAGVALIAGLLIGRRRRRRRD